MNAYNEEKPEIYIYIYMSRFKLRLFPNSALSKYKLKPHVLKDRTDHPPPPPLSPTSSTGGSWCWGGIGVGPFFKHL